MAGRTAIRSAALGFLLAGVTTGACRAAAPDLSCDLAATKAERDWNLPAGILSAVGSVESGRSGRTGRAPWPWTINAVGRGTYHESKEEAIATVLGIMERGFPYIDVGCFQVDLAYHAGVFSSLDEAFDPDQNAQAAARILLTSRMSAPDWATAVARYHSATPGLASAYLDRVLGALPAAKLRAVSAQTLSATDASIVIAPAPIQPAIQLPIVVYARPITGRRVEPQIILIRALPESILKAGSSQPKMARR